MKKVKNKISTEVIYSALIAMRLNSIYSIYRPIQKIYNKAYQEIKHHIAQRKCRVKQVSVYSIE